jgi:poly-gamma-glutamate capsule biosynthesis protein CapA/YwtB (metallophosphatase superfamily)
MMEVDASEETDRNTTDEMVSSGDSDQHLRACVLHGQLARRQTIYDKPAELAWDSDDAGCGPENRTGRVPRSGRCQARGELSFDFCSSWGYTIITDEKRLAACAEPEARPRRVMPWLKYDSMSSPAVGHGGQAFRLFWPFRGLDNGVNLEPSFRVSITVRSPRPPRSAFPHKDIAMKSKPLLYSLTGFLFFTLLTGPACGNEVATREQDSRISAERTAQLSITPNLITVFVCGDVMTGRGIDQVLPHPGDPLIHEPYMQSARGYVELAEKANGLIQKPVDFAYIWGDALEELERVKPDVRMINLETSVTRSNDYWKGKGIHYRMNPQNIPCLTAAQIDYCSLANNHVLDWGYAGLAETLGTLKKAHIKSGGAGQDLQEAEAPAVIGVGGKGRVVVFSYGLPTSGIPVNWGASEDRAGVNLLEDLSDQAVRRIKQRVAAVKRQGDIVVVSIHWGSNWGYDIAPQQIEFAHKLIDDAGVAIIHGHSSHHVKGIEVYKDSLVLYGCGDFINDYEGISGYEGFRSDLALMYFVSTDPSSGKLIDVRMTPMQIKYLKANRASRADALWLGDTLNREGDRFGTRVEINRDDTLTLRWD